MKTLYLLMLVSAIGMGGCKRCYTCESSRCKNGVTTDCGLPGAPSDAKEYDYCSGSMYHDQLKRGQALTDNNGTELKCY